jgi:hypothetical protein
VNDVAWPSPSLAPVEAALFSKAILEVVEDPKRHSFKFVLRILDPNDTSWMDLPAEKVIQSDEKISKEIEKLAKRPKSEKYKIGFSHANSYGHHQKRYRCPKSQ